MKISVIPCTTTRKAEGSFLPTMEWLIKGVDIRLSSTICSHYPDYKADNSPIVIEISEVEDDSEDTLYHK